MSERVRVRKTERERERERCLTRRSAAVNRRHSAQCSAREISVPFVAALHSIS